MTPGPPRTELAAWADETPDVLAIGLVGSHARGTAGPGSDVDLIVVARDPDRLLGDAQWLSRFGRRLGAGHEDYGLVRSLRCVDADGVELEFGLTSPAWCAPPIDPGTAAVIAGGMRILHDPEGRLGAARRWVRARGR